MDPARINLGGGKAVQLGTYRAQSPEKSERLASDNGIGRQSFGEQR